MDILENLDRLVQAVLKVHKDYLDIAEKPGLVVIPAGLDGPVGAVGVVNQGLLDGPVYLVLAGHLYYL